MMKVRGVVVGVVALALVGGGVAWAVQQQPRPVSYTTATAVRGGVTQTLTASGTVQRTGRHDLGFDSPGLVTALSVRVGDQVQAGAKLASVDPAPLQLSLLQAQAQLAQARATLDADRTAKDNGGSVTALPGASGGVPAGSAGGAGASGGLGSGASGTPATPAYVTALQSSLKKLQGTVATQQAACAPVYAVVAQLQQLQAQLPTTLPTSLPTTLPTALPSGHPGHSASPSPTPTATSSPAPTTPAVTTGEATPSATPSSPEASPGTQPASPSASDTSASPSASASGTAPAPKLTGGVHPTPSVTLPAALSSLSPEQAKKLAGSLQACTAAMVGLAGAEQEAGQAIVTAAAGLQAATAAAQQQLVAAQAQLVSAAEAAARQAAAQAMAEAQAQLAAQAQRALGGTVTDATLAADRARVLQSQQAVDRAQRALDAATLTTPVGGVVGAIGLVAGESSAGRTVTIVAPGAAAVDVQIPLSVRALVSAGMTAVVGSVGADPTLHGAVESVSVLATSAAARPTYTARVLVDDPGLTLPAGSKAEATLTLATASDVVTVPLSAVTPTSATTGTVEVVSDARAESSQVVQVTTGAYGGGRVEITSGLQPGQLVVLADRRLPVPGGLQQYQQQSQSPTPTPTKQ